MFRYELDLQNEFKKMLENNLDKNEVVLKEFDARFGNVDLVKVSYKSFNPSLEQQFKILSNHATSVVVAFLHKKQKRSFKYLHEKTGYTYDYLKKIIKTLKKYNIINEVSENCFVISDTFNFPKLKFISYELKLKDWQHAVFQAKKNEVFSYKSFVVMPDDIALKIKAKHTDIFKLYNVGLIAVNKNSYKIIINCKVNNTKIIYNPTLISSIAKSVILKNQIN